MPSAALATSVGKIAIKAWGGIPKDPKTETSGAVWMLAGDWVPYQLPTFVTPAFQGYKDLKRMTALMRQPRTAANEPTGAYSILSVTRSI